MQVCRQASRLPNVYNTIEYTQTVCLSLRRWAVRACVCVMSMGPYRPTETHDFLQATQGRGHLRAPRCRQGIDHKVNTEVVHESHRHLLNLEDEMIFAGDN
jgi:hypothetical protein